MRVGFIVGSPPKKLGSLEQWMLGIAAEARRRGHTIDLFTVMPVHPQFEEELGRIGAGLSSIDALEASPVESVRRLAGYDVLHVNMLSPRREAMLLCYAAWPAKIIVVDHESRDGARLPGLRRELSRALDQVTLLRVDELVGVSEYVRSRDVRRFGIDERRTRVIYNGVDPGRFTMEKTPSPDGALRLLCVAQLIPEKGIDVLLRAMTYLKTRPTRLRVAGFGRMAEAYQTLARQLGLGGRVEFLGKRDDVHLLLKDTELMVHPAIWQEAFGLTVAEGMAAGCGVVASRVGGIPELITDGVDGLMVPPGDELALARAIDSLAADPLRRGRLAHFARDKVERRFSLERCVHEHVDCIEQVAFDRRAARIFVPELRRPNVLQRFAQALKRREPTFSRREHRLTD